MSTMTERCVYTVLFLLMAAAQDADGVSCQQPEGYWQQCQGLSTKCCPSISYSRIYRGTTFSSCCPSESKFTVGKSFCANSYAAQLFCTKSSKHCCPSATSTYGTFYSGCCFLSQTKQPMYMSTGKCLKDWNYWEYCYGVSTQCCPFISYSPEYTRSGTVSNNVFHTCCNSVNYLHKTRFYCVNDYGRVYCRDSAHSCCASATWTLGKWHRGCCTLSSKSGGSGSHGSSTVIGTIIGVVVGVLIIVIIIGLVVGVVCVRRNAANRRNTAAMTARQGGYPQQQLGTTAPYGGGYPTQANLFVVQRPPPTGPVIMSDPSYTVGGQPGPAGPAGYPTVGPEVQGSLPSPSGPPSYTSAGPGVNGVHQPSSAGPPSYHSASPGPGEEAGYEPLATSAPSVGPPSYSSTTQGPGVEAGYIPLAPSTGPPSYPPPAISPGLGVEAGYIPPSTGPDNYTPNYEPPAYDNIAYSNR